MFPAVAEIIAQIHLGRIKGNLESLIDKDQAGSSSGSFYPNRINTPRADDLNR